MYAAHYADIHCSPYGTVRLAAQHTDKPLPQSAILDLHPVARKLLLISYPAEGRRLSWPEHTIDCFKMSIFLPTEQCAEWNY